MQQFSGKSYLKIDIANNYGLDKKSWNERLEWFDANKDRLIELMPQAEEPALYFAGVQAWFNTQRGLPSGYPISLDATASGLQILAVLTGDRKAAELCNVVDTGDRQDAYTLIYEGMTATLGQHGRISRDDVKNAIVPALYSSRAKPKEIFGEGHQLTVFYETINMMAPAAWELNEAFIQMWDSSALINSWVLPDNFHVHVKVMARVIENVQFLNMPYETFRSVNQPTEEGRSLGANTVHSIDGMIVREVVRRCNYDKTTVENLQMYLDYLNQGGEVSVDFDDDENADMVRTLWKHYEESGYLSARIIDHLNLHNLHLVQHGVISELLESLPDAPFEVITVHDCFRCLPNHGNDLRMQYTRQLYEIAKSNLLQYILGQILKRNLTIGKLDESLAEDILQSDYALS